YNETTWVFLHVEKTGGTSLQNMLLQSFGAARVYHEHNDSLHLHSPAQLSMYSVFAGHFNYDSLAFIPRRQLKLLTFGPEPMPRGRVIESLRAPIRERLREFSFVGLQENFTGSCRELFRIMGRPCPDERADHSVEQLSGTSSYIRKSARPVLTPRAIEVMADLVELDAMLYEEAKTLYTLRLARRRNVARAQVRRDSTHARSRPR